jgi:peroxiredoxin
MLPPYQVVPQWPADSISDYDALVAIENLLIENLLPDNQTDADGAVSKAYEAFNPEKNMSRRVTAVIDKEGKIKKYFATVNPEGHSQEVLGILNS